MHHTYETQRDVLLTKQNKVGATVVSSYNYQVNSLGQRTQLQTSGTAVDAARSVVWAYDALGQVVSANASIATQSRAYQYDTIGNRVRSAESLTLPAEPNYQSNALNQYTQAASQAPVHDLDGNPTTYPLSTGLGNLVWDAENRLIQSTVNGIVTSYQYDAQSRRVATQKNGQRQVWIYDSWNPVAQYQQDTASAILTNAYTWGIDLSGSGQGAGGVGGLLAVQQGSITYYPTYDGNGNVSQYIDLTGNVVAHYEYDPFGNITFAQGSKANDFAHRFSTKPLDPDTGLMYYGYRHYSPKTGQFLGRDPIQERGGVNLYGFVGNDGIGQSDLLGMQRSFMWQVLIKSEFDTEFDHSFIKRPYSGQKIEYSDFGQSALRALNPLSAKLFAHYLSGSGSEYDLTSELLLKNEVISAGNPKMQIQHNKIKSAAESFTCPNEKLGNDSKSYPIGKEEYSNDITPFDVTSKESWVIRKSRGGFRSKSKGTVVCACDPDDGKIKPIATWVDTSYKIYFNDQFADALDIPHMLEGRQEIKGSAAFDEIGAWGINWNETGVGL